MPMVKGLSEFAENKVNIFNANIVHETRFFDGESILVGGDMIANEWADLFVIQGDNLTTHRYIMNILLMTQTGNE